MMAIILGDSDILFSLIFWLKSNNVLKRLFRETKQPFINSYNLIKVIY